MPLLWKIKICRRRMWKLMEPGDQSEGGMIKANVVGELTYSRPVIQPAALGKGYWD